MPAENSHFKVTEEAALITNDEIQPSLDLYVRFELLHPGPDLRYTRSMQKHHTCA